MALTNKPPFETQLKNLLREATVHPNMLNFYQDKVDELTAKYRQEIIFFTLAEVLHAVYGSETYELGVDLVSVAVLGRGDEPAFPKSDILRTFSDAIFNLCNDDLKKLIDYLSRRGYLRDLPFE